LAIRVHDGIGSLPLFSEDVERANDAGLEPVIRLREAVAIADGLLIATPEYNWSIPGVLKNAIDWLSRSSPEAVLTGKPIAIVGASVGPWGTRQAQSVLRHTLAATESFVMPAPTLVRAKRGEPVRCARRPHRSFDEGGIGGSARSIRPVD
jgi:chromate reductase